MDVIPPLPVASTLNAPADASRARVEAAGTVNPEGQTRYGAEAAVQVVVPLGSVPHTAVPADGTLTEKVKLAVVAFPAASATLVLAVYGLLAAVGAAARVRIERVPLRVTVPDCTAPFLSLTANVLEAMSSSNVALMRVTAPAVVPSAGLVETRAGGVVSGELRTLAAAVAVKLGQHKVAAAIAAAAIAAGRWVRKAHSSGSGGLARLGAGGG